MLPDADGFELVGELRDLAVARRLDPRVLGLRVEARRGAGLDGRLRRHHPQADRAVAAGAAHRGAPAGAGRERASKFGAGRRLVVADDDPMQLKLATFRLARLGFEVEAVADGASALDGDPPAARPTWSSPT